MMHKKNNFRSHQSNRYDREDFVYLMSADESDTQRFVNFRVADERYTSQVVNNMELSGIAWRFLS